MFTQLPMYYLYLEGDRIQKDFIYQYLTDIVQARSLAKTKNIGVSDVILNHSLILKNVLFKSRGNFYLTPTSEEG